MKTHLKATAFTILFSFSNSTNIELNEVKIIFIITEKKSKGS